MKKVFSLFAAIMMIPVLLFSQVDQMNSDTSINKLDANKAKTGYWVEKSGDQFVKGNYINNKKTGIWISTLQSNLIQRLENYVDGKKEGISIEK